MAEVDRYLRFMVQSGASDFHLSSGVRPMFRVHGRMVSTASESAEPFAAEQVARLVEGILPPHNREEFAERSDTDFAYEIPGAGRFRVNAFHDRQGMGAVFRHIPDRILSFEDLGLPAVLARLCMLQKGLVLVTGPTGSGKSTTLAAMVDYINTHRADHIVTVEDPIEFVHGNRRCLVNQREVRRHTESFKSALRAALRQDPDIILVGEMRDLETTEMAIETAETGHLVLGTLHTTTAASTVDRIIDQFPADRQSQIRAMLATSLKGVAAQALLRRRDGKGRIAAFEIMVATAGIANNIREGKTFHIPSAIQTGGRLGMQTLNDHILRLVKAGTVEPAEAYAHSVDKADMGTKLKVAGHEIA